MSGTPSDRWGNPPVTRWPAPMVLSRGSHAPGEGFSLTEAVAYAAGEEWTQWPRCASPVLVEWLIVINDQLDDHDRQGLLRYVSRLTRSRGTTQDEVVRHWMVVDWAIRQLLPTWLDSLGLRANARQLSSHPPVVDLGGLNAAAASAQAAADAAAQVHDATWRAVADMAQPGAEPAARRPPWRPASGDVDPQRVRAWGGLADGTRAAVDQHRSLLDPAAAATGYARSEVIAVPPVWNTIASALKSAEAAIAWTGVHRLVTGADWSWLTPPDDTWSAAHAVARDALGEQRTHAYRLADELTERLLAATERWGRA